MRYVLLLICLLCYACGSPNTPTAPEQMVWVTIRVFETHVETPIPRASVSVDGVLLRTDDSGTIRVQVPYNKDIYVEASAPGYLTVGAGGKVVNEERWTFYLFPLNSPLLHNDENGTTVIKTALCMSQCKA
jgi:hypothetical protein